MKSSAKEPLPIGRAIATIGATVLALVMTGTSVVSVIWASVTLLGLPDFFLWGLLVLGAIPIIWGTLWTAGRAWHVERNLEQGLDIDQPVFKLGAYFHREPREQSQRQN
ncbi:MAG TPA: hypothetical protein VH933_16055 [Aestuariivirgaceae bacterium]|jgi:hypothetical protein